MSVSIRITGPCKDCEYIDIKFSEHEPVAGEKWYSARCVHEPMCYKMQEEHKKAMREIDKALASLDSSEGV